MSMPKPERPKAVLLISRLGATPVRCFAELLASCPIDFTPVTPSAPAGEWPERPDLVLIDVTAFEDEASLENLLDQIGPRFTANLTDLSGSGVRPSGCANHGSVCLTHQAIKLVQDATGIDPKSVHPENITLLKAEAVGKGVMNTWAATAAAASGA